MKLPMLAADKANHVIYGALAFAAGAAFAAAVGLARYAPVAGLAATVLLAAAKEGADWLQNRRAAKAGLGAAHSVEPRDLLATVAGGLAAWGLAELGAAVGTAAGG